MRKHRNDCSVLFNSYCKTKEASSGNHLPKERAATKAVVMLLAQRTAAWSSSIPPLEIAPKHTAATAARKPTTVA